MENTPDMAAKTFLEFARKNKDTIDMYFRLYREFQDTVKQWNRPQYLVYSLAEEAMEFQAAMRTTKECFRGDEIQNTADAALKELGDVFFFWAALADEDTLDIIESNVIKILDRSQRGVIKGDGDAR